LIGNHSAGKSSFTNWCASASQLQIVLLAPYRND
jgi:hypothetical protein